MIEQIVLCGTCNGYGEYATDGRNGSEKTLCFNCNGSGRMIIKTWKETQEVERKQITAFPQNKNVEE